MFETDLLPIGAHPIPLKAPEGFEWVLPVLWGYAEAAEPVLMNPEDGLFLYVLQGRGEVEKGDSLLPYEADLVLTACGGEALVLSPRENTEYLYLALRHARSLLERIGPMRLIPRDSGLCRMLKRFCNSVQSGPVNPYRASATVFSILMEACAQTDGEKPAYRPLVRDAIDIIRRECVFLAGVEELAGLLGVSANHLIRVFKDDTGTSPGRYLQEVRLDHARLFLQNQEYTVETVAQMAGYSSTNYFCKVFRSAFGESPGQYRASCRTAATSPRTRTIRGMEDLMHL